MMGNTHQRHKKRNYIVKRYVKRAVKKDFRQIKSTIVVPDIDSKRFVGSMKIAIVMHRQSKLLGSRYKYYNLLCSFANIKLFYEHDPNLQNNLRNWEPDVVCCWGDTYTTWKKLKQYGYRYVLFEHDVATLRGNQTDAWEREMITSAAAVITVSPPLANYIGKQYGVDATVVYLKPLAQDLDFKPLPKLDGKHLVYSGGLHPKKVKSGPYGYRCYHDIFGRFIQQGWTVHLYSARSDNLQEYINMGCVVHTAVPQGKKLYKELSQYTAGFHGYVKDSVSQRAFEYTQLAAPNKTWEYLAAGIPTIGFQSGYGGKIFDKKWGIVLDTLDDLPGVEDAIQDLDVDQYRRVEIMDSQKDEVKTLFETYVPKTRLIAIRPVRVRQAYIGRSMNLFRSNFFKKYDLIEYTDKTKPLAIFGFYRNEDYDVLANHRNNVIAVWCGNDSVAITSKKHIGKYSISTRLKLLKQSHVKHIARSKFISDDLKKLGIKHELIPITSFVSTDFNAVPRGDCIYHYGNGKNNFYGDHYLDGIEKRTGLKIIRTTINTYSRADLLNIYKQCFIGLRLTLHDGLPNTVLELGALGRRSIYNGEIPHSIPWQGLDDICESIMWEYENRHQDDGQDISRDIKQYIDVGDEWLVT